MTEIQELEDKKLSRTLSDLLRSEGASTPAWMYNMAEGMVNLVSVDDLPKGYATSVTYGERFRNQDYSGLFSAYPILSFIIILGVLVPLGGICFWIHRFFAQYGAQDLEYEEDGFTKTTRLITAILILLLFFLLFFFAIVIMIANGNINEAKKQRVDYLKLADEKMKVVYDKVELAYKIALLNKFNEFSEKFRNTTIAKANFHLGRNSTVFGVFNYGQHKKDLEKVLKSFAGCSDYMLQFLDSWRYFVVNATHFVWHIDSVESKNSIKSLRRMRAEFQALSDKLMQQYKIYKQYNISMDQIAKSFSAVQDFNERQAVEVKRVVASYLSDVNEAINGIGSKLKIITNRMSALVSNVRDNNYSYIEFPNSLYTFGWLACTMILLIIFCAIAPLPFILWGEDSSVNGSVFNKSTGIYLLLIAVSLLFVFYLFLALCFMFYFVHGMVAHDGICHKQDNSSPEQRLDTTSDCETILDVAKLQFISRDTDFVVDSSNAIMTINGLQRRLSTLPMRHIGFGNKFELLQIDRSDITDIYVDMLEIAVYMPKNMEVFAEIWRNNVRLINSVRPEYTCAYPISVSLGIALRGQVGKEIDNMYRSTWKVDEVLQRLKQIYNGTARASHFSNYLSAISMNLSQDLLEHFIAEKTLLDASIVSALKNGIGSCMPITTLYRDLRQPACDSLVRSMNVFWFGVFMVMMLLLPMLFLLLHMIYLNRLYNTSQSFHTDNTESGRMTSHRKHNKIKKLLRDFFRTKIQYKNPEHSFNQTNQDHVTATLWNDFRSFLSSVGNMLCCFTPRNKTPDNSSTELANISKAVSKVKVFQAERQSSGCDVPKSSDNNGCNCDIKASLNTQFGNSDMHALNNGVSTQLSFPCTRLTTEENYFADVRKNLPFKYSPSCNKWRYKAEGVPSVTSITRSKADFGLQPVDVAQYKTGLQQARWETTREPKFKPKLTTKKGEVLSLEDVTSCQEDCECCSDECRNESESDSCSTSEKEDTSRSRSVGSSEDSSCNRSSSSNGRERGRSRKKRDKSRSGSRSAEGRKGGKIQGHRPDCKKRDKSRSGSRSTDGREGGKIQGHRPNCKKRDKSGSRSADGREGGKIQGHRPDCKCDKSRNGSKSAVGRERGRSRTRSDGKRRNTRSKGKSVDGQKRGRSKSKSGGKSSDNSLSTSGSGDDKSTGIKIEIENAGNCFSELLNKLKETLGCRGTSTDKSKKRNDRKSRNETDSYDSINDNSIDSSECTCKPICFVKERSMPSVDRRRRLAERDRSRRRSLDRSTTKGESGKPVCCRCNKRKRTACRGTSIDRRRRLNKSDHNRELGVDRRNSPNEPFGNSMDSIDCRCRCRCRSEAPANNGRKSANSKREQCACLRKQASNRKKSGRYNTESSSNRAKFERGKCCKCEAGQDDTKIYELYRRHTAPKPVKHGTDINSSMRTQSKQRSTGGSQKNSRRSRVSQDDHRIKSASGNVQVVLCPCGCGVATKIIGARKDIERLREAKTVCIANRQKFNTLHDMNQQEDC